MKVIAFYLPQFHRIKENDEWWGEGYTEWTAVRNAKPLFEGHYQPREPLGDNYYDLLHVDAARWQQDLAKRFGVYGFCYYHYWFMGRELLERPFDLVLRNPDLDLPFCLSWANQSWTRTWYGQTSAMLVAQEYGGPSDWEEHFTHVLPVFRDPRYIRMVGKPLFILHDPAHIQRCGEMMAHWNRLAKQHGLDGIFFVETLGGNAIDGRELPFDAQLHFEPGYTMVHDLPRRGPWPTVRRAREIVRSYWRQAGLPDRKVDRLLDYDRVCDVMVSRLPSARRTFLGVFPDWDNSPRRQYRSSVFRGSTPDRFEEYLVRQIRRSTDLFNSDLLFVNAWNEWGEGAYLEPDKRYGTRYLQAIKNALLRTR